MGERRARTSHGGRPKQLSLVHKLSSLHREAIVRSERCGCFCCLHIFPPAEIVRWCDADESGGRTALCPHCGVDSVLPSSLVPIDADLLARMKHTYFTGIE